MSAIIGLCICLALVCSAPVEAHAAVNGQSPLAPAAAPLGGGAERPEGALAQPEGPPAEGGVTERRPQMLNPDISVISDFLVGGPERAKPLSLRHLELAFSQAVDPFSRADVYLGVEPEEESEGGHGGHYGLHLEEGYLTLPALPGGLLARAGKFRSGVGKVNSLHLHYLPWPDYPLAVRHQFGPEGLAAQGASLSCLLGAPAGRYRELSYDVFTPDNHILFGHAPEGRVAHLLHFKDFHAFSKDADLEVGLSGLAGPGEWEDQRGRVAFQALDLTYRRRPLAKALYGGFLAQTEVLLCQRHLSDTTHRSWGMFAALQKQSGRRYSRGIWYDYSELPDGSGRREHNYSANITFLQSEYCYWRLTYACAHRNFADQGGKTDQWVSLQVNFGIGPHRAHKY